MTQTSLRSILESLASDIETYRDPDVWESQKRLSDLMEAAGLGGISSDTLTHLCITNDVVYGRVEWSAYSCPCDRRFEFPASIVDDHEPLKAAARWRLERERARIVDELEKAERLHKHWASKLAEFNEGQAAA